MTSTTVSNLKASLSAYLKQVKHGGEVLITEHGKPIAKIIPIVHSANFPEQLLELEKRGLVKAGTEKLPDDFFKMTRPQDSEDHALNALLEERHEGR